LIASNINSWEKKPLVALVGPTAVGKTDLVMKLASRLNGEVVSVDSMLVYRHMDIGTAKPSVEERNLVPHHLVDIVDPDEEYSVSKFIHDANRACEDIWSRDGLPLLAGGTGLYLKGFQDGVFSMDNFLGKVADQEDQLVSVREKLRKELDEEGREFLYQRLERCDPESAARIHLNDTSRLLRALEIYETTAVPWSEHLAKHQKVNDLKNGSRKRILKIGLTRKRTELYERINIRTVKMLELGLVEEVNNLHEMGYGAELKSMQAIGYRHAIKYLAGEWNMDETVEVMARDTRHYAKRQQTWFKRDHEIIWHEPVRYDEIETSIIRYLETETL